MRRPVFSDRWDRQTREEAIRWQEEMLRRFLSEEVGAHSPFYRKHFADHGVDPRRVRTLADLAQLPFTSKDQIVATAEEPQRPTRLVLAPDASSLRRSAPLDRLAGIWVQGLLQGREAVRARLGREYRPVFVTFTTGRSALPTPFFYSLYDLEILRETGRRIADAVGLDPHADRGLNLFPFAPHLGFWQVYQAGVAAGVLLLHTGGGKVMGTTGCLAALSRIRPTILMGVPGYVYHLLREAAARETDLSSVRLVVLGGDKASAPTRERIREILVARGARDPRVLSVYGFTEARTAWPECAGGLDTGFHLYPDLGVFEIVDPKTGDPVGDGQTGELVYTSLNWRGSCVVRYRTGDVVEGGMTWEPCPACGRTAPRIGSDLKRVSDRSAFNFSKVRGTLVDFNQVADVLSREPRIEEWQIVIRKANDDPFELDEMVLSVALRDGPEPPAAWAQAMQARFQDACEIAPNQVEIVPLEEMTRRLGMEDRLKEQRIVDRRPKT